MNKKKCSGPEAIRSPHPDHPPATGSIGTPHVPQQPQHEFSSFPGDRKIQKFDKAE
jgi:hypothetical protein